MPCRGVSYRFPFGLQLSCLREKFGRLVSFTDAVPWPGQKARDAEQIRAKLGPSTMT